MLGLLPGLSALVGVAGARLFPPLRARLGEHRAGLLGFTALSASLSISLVAVFCPGSPFTLAPATPGSLVSVALLLAGIVGSRLGLWLADLAVQQVSPVSSWLATALQVFQQETGEAERGSLSGVQGAAQAGLDLAKFLLVIALPLQQNFGFLVIISFTVGLPQQ